MATRTLIVDKAGRTYAFRYSAGSESRIVDEIMRLAGDRDSDLDWVDAAILSFRVTRHAAEDCKKALTFALDKG